VILEALSNLKTVQAFSMEAAELARFDRATRDMQRFSLKTEFYNALTRPITELLGVGMLGTAIIIGAYLVLNHETHVLGIQVCSRPLSVASMLVFFGLLIGATDPIRKLSTVLSAINTGVIAADMLYPILDRPSFIRDPQIPVAAGRPHRHLEFRDVTFAYDGREPALKNVSVIIPFKAMVAIIGPNGSGKSSFVNLLCRFYDPQQGSVALDGVDLRSMRLAELRARIGLVTQNTELFNEDITYNLGYGSPGCSQEEIVKAAKMAHAHQFIMELPDGYRTVLGQNGHRLSGGQRQRIALARAILRDPEILILDEATSQIDLESERLIQSTLEEFGRDRTVVFITHRTTMRDMADVTLQIDNGRVTVEQGPRAKAA
jgi:ATP-binding cassette subfamily B protein/subfamily B ATP-binding cassette protein MsbA